MKLNRAHVVALWCFCLLAGACTSSGDVAEPTTTAASTTSATTSTTATTTTTTTTTLPPGLQPTVLEYAYADGSLWTYDTTAVATVDMNLDLPADVDTSGDATIETEVTGVTKNLAIEQPDGTFEVVQDFLLDTGHVQVASDGQTFGQELTREDRESFREAAALSVGFDASGRHVAGSSGVPGVNPPPALFDRLSAYGPQFSSDPVDVGDSWPFVVEDSSLGRYEGTAEIVEEVEADGEYAFVIEFTVEGTELPLEIGLEEAAEDPALADQFALLAGIVDDALLTFETSLVSGTATFSPSQGLFTDLVVDTSSTVAISMTMADMTVGGFMELTASTTSELAGAGESTFFERTAILERYEVDPFDLAFERSFDLPHATFVADDETYTHFEDSITPVGGIVAGYVVVDVLTADGVASAVVITNGGPGRGYPLLAQDIGWLLTSARPTRVAVNGQDAWRIEIDGREWLMWNDDEFTYIVIGDRAVAVETIGDFIATSEPYFWGPGDCLDFSEYGGEVPFSSFGAFGLTHCSASHQYEVLYSELLEDGPDAPFPDDMSERRDRACGERFLDHTGAYPLQSELAMVTYMPNPDEWEKGARYIACVIYQQSGDGPVEITARLHGAGAANPVALSVGDCMNDGWVVDCSDPHDTEITAIAMYDAGPDAPFPSQYDIYDEMTELCEGPLEDYGVAEGPEAVEAGWMSDMLYGWDDGLREYYCVARVVQDDWTVDTVGSLRGEWSLAPEQVDA